MSILQRNNYKETWNGLSDTFQNAVINVTGDATEKQLQEFGKIDSQKIIEITEISTSDIVLEIGCGVGRLGFTIADKCREWIGCDISGNMLNHAKMRLTEKRNVNFVELNENNLSSVPDKSVDVVYCSVVFMHLEEWDRFSYIEDSFRVLRNGGRLYVDNFTIESEDGWQIFRNHQEIPPLKRKPEISKSSNSLEFDVYFRKAGFTHFQSRVSKEWVIGLARK